uniref:Secreted protein n=1 Tax=Heterorhabditis bacteriophora TaxID=37862 RepID=A0A1I7X8I3_HETBA
MISSRAGCLGPLALVLLFASTEAISKNFVNSSMPEMRPTFVVNFDMATVICQHRSVVLRLTIKNDVFMKVLFSEDPSDLHLHEMSVLCDGKRDCYQNPAMHDESFPYCGKLLISSVYIIHYIFKKHRCIAVVELYEVQKLYIYIYII